MTRQAKKQKILLALILIACAYIVWQFYGIYGGANFSSAAAITAKKAANSSVVSAANNTSKPPVLANLAGSAPILQENISQKSMTDQESDLAQERYTKMLDQYQLLKMKRMLLEEEVEIATAKQKIATLGGSADNGALNDSAALGYGGDVSANSSAAQLDDDGYSVVYIDYQAGNWSATINYQGRFEEVAVGTRMADGGKIIDIDRKGVILKRGAQYLKLTFNGAAVIKSDEVNKNANIAAKTTSDPVVPVENAPLIIKNNIAPVNQVSLPPKQEVVYQQLLQHNVASEKQQNYLSEKKTYYCLQLMQGVSTEKMRDFVTLNNIGDKVAYLQGANKSDVILVYGKYDSIALAKQALEKLPSSIKELSPWVRPLAWKLAQN